MTILVFLTAVDSCKQLLTAGKIFVFMCTKVPYNIQPPIFPLVDSATPKF